ncbi:MAG: RNA polymerase-binding protein DksA [Campylobacterales bacterium]|nr:RNA polymerase-binding protein DksA [Campylobacterales bacterium]
MRTREIERFEKILNEQKQQIIKNLKETAEEFKSLNASEANDEADQASISADTLIDSAISQQQSGELKDIEEALNRMANGTYGICDMCTENIDMERLKVKPHAKFCIDCREIYEKEKNGN